MTYDYLVEMYQKTGRFFSFPEALEGLRNERRLLREAPVTPPFYVGMDIDSFRTFIRGLSIDADPILPQAHTYLSDPTIEESSLFPDDKDVFCFLNMPYMVEIPHFHNFFEITYVIEGSCTFLFEGGDRHAVRRRYLHRVARIRPQSSPGAGVSGAVCRGAQEHL